MTCAISTDSLIATDRRRLEAGVDLEAHERAIFWAKGFVEHQIALARELCRINETRTFLHFGCASIEEYGLRLGLRWSDTHLLVQVSHALDEPVPPQFAEDGVATPRTVEEALREGAIPLDSVALAGRMLARPELVEEGEDPVETAMTTSVTRMRQLVRRREEEIAQQEPVTPLSLCVTHRAKADFARARSLASEQAGEMLTEGETFALVVGHYLDDYDPLRRGEGARRVRDTSELPEDRYVPSEVRRVLRLRSGERCEVPGCPRDTFLEFAHIESHREGGSREAQNLLRLCHRHHVLLDAGRIRFADWEAGHPRFLDSEGTVLTENAQFIAPEYRAEREGLDRHDAGTGVVSERPPPGYGAASASEDGLSDAESRRVPEVADQDAKLFVSAN